MAQILFYPNSGGTSAEEQSCVSLYLSCEVGQLVDDYMYFLTDLAVSLLPKKRKTP